MTKQREPLSPEEALTRIAADMGWAWMEKVTGKPVAMLRRASDPDHDHELGLRQAIALDTAYVRDRGEAPPILSAYQKRIEAETGGVTHVADDPHHRTCRLMKRIGDFAGVLSEALDDLVITREEQRAMALILRDCEELMKKLNADIAAAVDKPGFTKGLRP